MKNIRLFLCWSKTKLLRIVTEYKKACYITMAYCISSAFLLMNVDAVNSIARGEVVVQAKTIRAGRIIGEGSKTKTENKTNDKEVEGTKENHLAEIPIGRPVKQITKTFSDTVNKVNEEKASDQENKQEEYERKTTEEREEAETSRINQIKAKEEKQRRERARKAALDRYKMDLCSSERKVLERIVQAEAGNQDIKGKMLVANVVINRIRSSRFPNTVKAIVFQHSGGTYQFSPVQNGSIYRVKVSKETKKAVSRVLKGENYSSGALFFVARKVAARSNLGWFDRSLQRLFTHGGHTFYR
ncbi:spore cortex-lytic enzyme [Lachnospiraceae bacterium KM106-2]|nr:spore cortex-lytic enzyme [Lachnospiraceae bacterium KM106-2]